LSHPEYGLGRVHGGDQMKKLLVAGIAAAAFCGAPALAADMPVKGPVYKAAPAALYDWSGWYVGGNLGYGWGQADWTWDIPGLGDLRTDTKPKGILGGAQVGWQRQSGNFVGGFEFSWDAANLKNVTTNPDTAGVFGGFARDFHSKIDSIFLAAIRLGIANDRWLTYAKGGYAGGEDILDVFRTDIQVHQTHSSQWANGWTLGAGIEYAFANNWIAGLEYDYIRLSPSNKNGVNLPTTVLSNHINIDASVNVVMARLSYKFGGDPWGKSPVVAKY